jgi:lipoyl-dependent peroxiredoxin subunit D
MESIATYSETTQEFLDILKVEKAYRTETLDLLEEGKTRYLADLKIKRFRYWVWHLP